MTAKSKEVAVMEEYTLDEDGNRVSTMQPPSPHRSETETIALSTGAENGDEDGQARVDMPDGLDDLTDIFGIEGRGYDVTLSVTQRTLTWVPMNPSSGSGKKKLKRKLSGLFRTNKNAEINTMHGDTLPLDDLFGVRLKQRRQANQEEEDGVCLGFGVFTVEKKHSDSGVMRDKVVFFEHPSHELCSRWVNRIHWYLQNIPSRPRHIKLFLQPKAGSQQGRSLYRKRILPLFETADVTVDYTEIQHNEHIKHEMIHINLDDYDCIVCMGGDGTVSKITDGMMKRVYREKGVELKPNFPAIKCHVPLGIIPVGKTNHIAHSVMGCADAVTGVLHVIYGHLKNVDICSVLCGDKFQQWAFNCQYGFVGNVLTFSSRYNVLGSKQVDAAFLKALTKAKLRSYECDIEYIPATDQRPVDGRPCVAGCKVCWSEKEVDTGVTRDMVEELEPDGDVISNSSLIDLSADVATPWITCKGNYMNVGLFSIAGLCDMAPQGLSKFTHLNDGCLDLVLVNEVDRKDFIRYLRRHANSKNQFDFPFVETYRVKEVRFRPRFPISWHYNDHDFSEINYQMNKVKDKQPRTSVEIIDDLGKEDPRLASAVPFRNMRSASMGVLDVMCVEDSEDEDDDDDSLEIEEEVEEKKKGKENASPKGEKKPDPEPQPRPLKRTKSQPAFGEMEPERFVGPQYRMTFTEKEILRRRKHARKKEEKRKAREEAKMKAVWSVDNEICDVTDLDFKIHHGLLSICGLGVSPELLQKEARIGCLPAI